MILNTPLISDWGAIMRYKEELIDKNNRNKNKNHKPRDYIICEKVLVRDKKEKIVGSIKSSLPNYQGLEKCNCYHTPGRRTRGHTY